MNRIGSGNWLRTIRSMSLSWHCATLGVELAPLNFET
jgi:hypothetical protein